MRGESQDDGGVPVGLHRALEDFGLSCTWDLAVAILSSVNLSLVSQISHDLDD